MEPTAGEDEKLIKPLSIEAIVALILALFNLGLDQAEIHILLISWFSVAACIVLSLDAARRTKWAAKVGYRSNRFISACGAIVIVFLGAGVLLSIHKKTSDNSSVAVRQPENRATPVENSKISSPAPSREKRKAPSVPTPRVVPPPFSNPAPQPITQSVGSVDCGNALNCAGVNTGQQTVNVNGPIPRHIPESEKIQLATCLGAHPGTIVEVDGILGDSESLDLANEWLTLFRKAGWKTPEGISQIVPMNKFAGTVFHVHGHLDGNSNPVFDSDVAGRGIPVCFVGKHFAGGKGLYYSSSIDVDHISIAVGYEE